MARGIVRRVFSDTMVYGFTKYFAVLASVFLTPIYTRLLTKEDFGTMDVFNTWNTMIIAILPLGLFNAMLRFFPEVKDNKADRKRLFGAILSSILAACGVYCLLILVCKELFFSNLIGNSEPQYVFYYSIVVVVMAVLHAYFLQILQIRFEKYRYMTVSFTNFIILTALGFYLVYALNQGIEGFFLASVIALSTSNLLGAIFVYSDLHIQFNWSQIKTLISYSVHFVTVFFLFQLSQVVDRYVINKYLDLSNVGVYSIAVRVGNLLQIAISSFGTAWMPYAMSLKDHEKAKMIYSKVFDLFVIGLVAIISALLLFRREMILFFAPDYMDAYSTIFWILLTNFVMGFIFVFTLGIQITKRSQFLSIAALFSITINFIVSILLVDKMGIEGVAVGSLCGAAAWIGIQHFFSQKYYPVKYNYLKNVVIIILIGVPLLSSIFLDQKVGDIFTSIMIKSALVIVMFISVLVYLMRSKSVKEIRSIPWK